MRVCEYPINPKPTQIASNLEKLSDVELIRSHKMEEVIIIFRFKK